MTSDVGQLLQKEALMTFTLPPQFSLGSAERKKPWTFTMRAINLPDYPSPQRKYHLSISSNEANRMRIVLTVTFLTSIAIASNAVCPMFITWPCTEGGITSNSINLFKINGKNFTKGSGLAWFKSSILKNKESNLNCVYIPLQHTAHSMWQAELKFIMILMLFFF